MTKHVCFMLDTNICSYIMRGEQPLILERLQEEVNKNTKVYISVITYQEMLLSLLHKKGVKHAWIVDGFIKRLDSIVPWGADAAKINTQVTKKLSSKKLDMNYNDCAIAAHAIAENCILITDNCQRYKHIDNLRVEGLR